MKRSRLTLRVVEGAAFLLLHLAAQRAAANPEGTQERVELSWVRHADADSCMTGSELRQGIRERLGRDPFREPYEQHIEGYVARQGALWIADLVVRNRDSVRVGSRHLESAAESCRELDQAVVLTLTLVIDPNAPRFVEPAPMTRVATHQPSQLTQGSKPELQTAAPAAGSAIKHTASADRPHAVAKAAAPIRTKPASIPPPMAVSDTTVSRSRLLVATAAASGLLPGSTYGLTLRAEIPIARHFQLESSAAFFPERVSFNQNTVVGYGLTALGAGGCYAIGRTITWLACASAWLGAAHAIVYRGTPDRPGDRIWGGLRADLGYAVTWGMAVAELRGFVWLPVTRWNFTTSEGDSQFRQAHVAPGAEIAVGIRLP